MKIDCLHCFALGALFASALIVAVIVSLTVYPVSAGFLCQ
jgi:hypothetical protein